MSEENRLGAKRPTTGRETGEVGLKAGWHPLRVEYFGVGANQSLQLQWRGPGVSKSDIPTERLGHL